MSLFKQFSSSKQKASTGVWVEYSPNEDGTIPAFLIARAHKFNKRYATALAAATQPHRRALATETLDNKTAEKVMLQVFLDAILLDWRNVYDEAGAPMVYSRASAESLLTKLPELYDDLDTQSKSLALYREEELAADLKN